MGARRTFSRGGQIRGLGTEVPKLSPMIELRWDRGVLGAKTPEADARYSENKK